MDSAFSLKGAVHPRPGREYTPPVEGGVVVFAVYGEYNGEHSSTVWRQACLVQIPTLVGLPPSSGANGAPRGHPRDRLEADPAENCGRNMG